MGRTTRYTGGPDSQIIESKRKQQISDNLNKNIIQKQQDYSIVSNHKTFLKNQKRVVIWILKVYNTDVNM